MLKQTKVALSLAIPAFMLFFEAASDAAAASKLPDPHRAGVADSREDERYRAALISKDDAAIRASPQVAIALP